MTLDFRAGLATASANPSGTLAVNIVTNSNGDALTMIVVDDQSGDITVAAASWTRDEMVDDGSSVNAMFHKTASGEGATINVTGLGTQGVVAGMVSQNPNGGTIAYDDSNVSNTDGTSLTSGSVTVNAGGGALIIGFGHDNGETTVTSPPAGMTLCFAVTAGGSVSLAMYYQNGLSAGAVTKSITWNSTEQLTSSAATWSVSGGASALTATVTDTIGSSEPASQGVGEGYSVDEPSISLGDQVGFGKGQTLGADSGTASDAVATAIATSTPQQDVMPEAFIGKYRINRNRAARRR